ncbi:MAG: hypothetical protein MJY49_03175 [Bacteroidales bacterium]|nr:hypothetical protein [Bacteroidales bacterium]
MTILAAMGYGDRPERTRRWMKVAGIVLALAIAVPVTNWIHQGNERDIAERREAFERSILYQIEVYLEERGIVDEGLAYDLSEFVLKEKAYYFEVEDELPTIDEEKLDGLLRIIIRHSVVTPIENE